MRGGSLSLSLGGVSGITLPRWRPSARLTTERYVNEQIPQYTAAWDTPPYQQNTANYTKSPRTVSSAAISKLGNATIYTETPYS